MKKNKNKQQNIGEEVKTNLKTKKNPKMLSYIWVSCFFPGPHLSGGY